MLYLGLTQATIEKMALEQGTIIESSTAKIIQQVSVFGTPNFTISGANKRVFDLTFDSLENADFDQFKLYCVPYISQRVWVKMTNGLTVPTTIYEGWGFCHLQDLTLDYNYSKQSFKLTIYQL